MGNYIYTVTKVKLVKSIYYIWWLLRETFCVWKTTFSSLDDSGKIGLRELNLNSLDRTGGCFSVLFI